MERKVIFTNKAPEAIGPYEQGIRMGNLLFTSGQIALDPASGDFLSGNIEAETQRTLQNLDAILQASGLSRNEVVKVTVYMQDLGEFTRMNQVYGEYFAQNKPARACVQVAALPKGARVEMDAIAVFPE